MLQRLYNSTSKQNHLVDFKNSQIFFSIKNKETQNEINIIKLEREREKRLT